MDETTKYLVQGISFLLSIIIILVGAYVRTALHDKIDAIKDKYDKLEIQMDELLQEVKEHQIVYAGQSAKVEEKLKKLDKLDKLEELLRELLRNRQ